MSGKEENKELTVKFEDKHFELTKADSEHGVNKYKYSDKGVFKDALKSAGISKASYDGVKSFEKQYAKSAVTAIAEFSKKTLLKDKKLKGTVVAVPFGGNGTIQAATTREISGSIAGKDYRVSGFSSKIEEHLVSATYIKEIKEGLTKSLLS